MKKRESLQKYYQRTESIRDEKGSIIPYTKYDKSTKRSGRSLR